MVKKGYSKVTQISELVKMFASNVNITKITTQSMSFKTDQNNSRTVHFGRNNYDTRVVKYTFLFSSFIY